MEAIKHQKLEQAYIVDRKLGEAIISKLEGLVVPVREAEAILVLIRALKQSPRADVVIGEDAKNEK